MSDGQVQTLVQRILGSIMLLDRNRLNKLQSYSLPSNSYIDLTLGTSGTYYSAPADGWIIFGKQTTSANQAISILKNNILHVDYTPATGFNLFVHSPVVKGDRFQVQYNAGGLLQIFRFYYTLGSQPA